MENAQQPYKPVPGPDIQPPVTVPDNPPKAPPEIKPGKDPDAPEVLPDIEPAKRNPEIENPEKTEED